MSFRITYSRLFVCHVWHAYHLDMGESVRFHGLDPAVDATKRTDLLREYDLRGLVDFRPLRETAVSMRGLRMKLQPSPTGFFVAVSTKVFVDGGHQPLIEARPDQRWHFGLYPRNAAAWANAINQPMRPNLPAIHYFTNDRPDWTPDPVSPETLNLAGPAAIRQARRYETGEIVTDGTTRFRSLEPIKDLNIPFTDTDRWEAETPDFGEATDTDRCLLPTRFEYTLTPNALEWPSTLTVRLQDEDGADALPATTHDVTPGDDRLKLNFSAVTKGWYDLTVTSDTAYETTHRIYLDDDHYDPTAWGIISIGISPDDPALRLVEPDGRLRRNAADRTEPPEFEIRLANRRTYWRYKAHPSQELPPLLPGTAFTLDPDSVLLVTKRPRPLTRYGSPLFLNDAIPLPNPPPEALHPEDDGRVYSDTYLGVLKL